MSGVPSWAVRGAKVVCVDVALRERRWGAPDELTRGAVYTIRGINSRDGLLLREVSSCQQHRDREEVGYRIGRFRPAVPPKSQAEDVAQFLHLLTPERADA